MPDRREEIIGNLYGVVGDGPCVAYTESEVKSAMDEYMRETCLELLEYVGKNIKWPIEIDGNILFWNGKEYLTAQQIFESFL
jgi:hypothetical protein